MRDHRKPPEYWPVQLENDLARIEKAQTSFQDQSLDDRKRGRSANRFIDLEVKRGLALYSSGAACDDVAAQFKRVLSQLYPAYLEAFPAGTRYGATRPTHSQIVRYFAALILSRPTQSETVRFLGAYDSWDFQAPPDPGHRDAICEEMAKYLVPEGERPKASGVNWPEAYGALWKAIDPEADDFTRAHYVKEFLTDWYKHMASELAAETELHGPNVTDGLYVGYWCLEAAAATVMLNVDDTSFRDHEHYPADLADWARTR